MLVLRKNSSFGDWVFNGFNYTLLILLAVATLFPFLNILAVSFATPKEVLESNFLLFPKTFTLEAYRFIFSGKTVVNSLLVSVLITVVGTIINIALTWLTAYPLSRRNLKGRRTIMLMIVFTIMFSSGMIPHFLLIKNLGLLNTYWSLWLPGAINAFNLIIVINFIRNLPEGLEESAIIDGCNDFQVLMKIIVPLSLPALATFALFYAVGHWNTFFNALIYISDHKMWPIQVLLRQVVILSSGGVGGSNLSMETTAQLPPQSVKMAIIVVATLPILCVYPFLQKHFAKGVLLGSMKG